MTMDANDLKAGGDEMYLGMCQREVNIRDRQYTMRRHPHSTTVLPIPICSQQQRTTRSFLRDELKCA
jgi:hypothetical protein